MIDFIPGKDIFCLWGQDRMNKRSSTSFNVRRHFYLIIYEEDKMVIWIENKNRRNEERKTTLYILLRSHQLVPIC
jgi:hypothetical protein